MHFAYTGSTYAIWLAKNLWRLSQENAPYGGSFIADVCITDVYKSRIKKVEISASQSMPARFTFLYFRFCFFLVQMYDWPLVIIFRLLEMGDRQKQTKSLKTAPGIRVMRLIRFVYSKKSISRIFEPIHADFIEEYLEALNAGEKWKSRWIRVRYYWAFLSASGLLSVVSIAKKVVKFWQQVA